MGLVLPWNDWQNHAHWARVQWIPFVTPPVKLLDVIGNVLLYVPYGFFFPPASRRRWPAVTGTALALSCVTEWTQLYSHARFPSLTDVTCNVIGAALGVLFQRLSDSDCQATFIDGQ